MGCGLISARRVAVLRSPTRPSPTLRWPALRLLSIHGRLAPHRGGQVCGLEAQLGGGGRLRGDGDGDGGLFEELEDRWRVETIGAVEMPRGARAVLNKWLWHADDGRVDGARVGFVDEGPQLLHAAHRQLDLKVGLKSTSS